MIDDIFEPFERLIKIEISGETKSVPENNSLLRAFQFLAPEIISYGEFCWNGECANCRVWLAGEQGQEEKPRLACRTKVAPGMRIVKLADAIKFED
jgi:NADH dehydrogenase/NADH:ubiquinone oxidoreductase subunit G